VERADRQHASGAARLLTAPLFDELRVAFDGGLGHLQAAIADLDWLTVDDLTISRMGAAESNDLLESLNDCVGTRSTLIIGQLPTKVGAPVSTSKRWEARSWTVSCTQATRSSRLARSRCANKPEP
jgi:hypothetical protein